MKILLILILMAMNFTGAYGNTINIQTLLNGTTKIYAVEGPSMEPALHTGDRMVVDTGYYATHPIQRGDIIIFKTASTKIYVKRVLGLPGEKVKILNEKVYINDKLRSDLSLTNNLFSCPEMKSTDNQVFVIGDNVNNSNDSRNIGPIEIADIMGKMINIIHGSPLY